MNERPAKSPRPIRSLNPATGQLVREFEPDSLETIERKVSQADSLFRSTTRDAALNASRLARAAEILEQDQERFAGLMTLEMGKPIRSAVAEVQKCAACCRYYAENGPGFLKPESVKVSDSGTYQILYQALGPVLAVMPWNFPYWQVFRFAAPALVLGNPGLLKHASNVPQCALAIEEVFTRAGFPEGSFQTLLVGSEAVPAIIGDRRVAAVTATGSVQAGRKVAAEAGKHLKKTVMELGGSDPFIVTRHADVARAAEFATRSRCINSGQSCIAAKRFIVEESVFAEFERCFVEHMRALRIGDPADETTDIGPLATEAVFTELQKQVRRSVELGAELLLGGQPLSRAGFFYPPTILKRVPPDAPAAREELFGPVATLFTAKNIAGAIEIANASEFGLGACLWSRDAREQAYFIQNIQAGLAHVNGMVASDPRLPFGGVKNSGYGRELSRYGLLEFANIKTVAVQGG